MNFGTCLIGALALLGASGLGTAAPSSPSEKRPIVLADAETVLPQVDTTRLKSKSPGNGGFNGGNGGNAGLGPTSLKTKDGKSDPCKAKATADDCSKNTTP